MSNIYKFLLSTFFFLSVSLSGYSQCEVVDLNVTIDTLDNNVYVVVVDFDYANPASDLFELSINQDTVYTYELGEMPVQIEIPCGNQTDEVAVCISGDLDCCAYATVLSPCGTSNNECFISDVNVTVDNCADEFFTAVVNFNYENPSLEGFTIQGNGVNYGSFAYSDLPIYLEGLLADCLTGYEFVVIDLENDGCQDFAEIGVVCCAIDECDLSDLTLQINNQTNESYDLTIDFEYINPGNDYFDMYLFTDDTLFYSVLLNELPFTLTLPCEMSGTNYVEICINDVPSCCINESYIVQCEPAPECNIWDVNVVVDDCLDETFNAVINFNHSNTGNDGFTIQGNGMNYGNFSYSNLPVVLEGLAADCNLEYEFVIIDIQNDGCQDYAELGSVCCEQCMLSNISIEIDTFIQDSYVITIDFEYENANNEFFEMTIDNGSTELYALTDLPLSVEVECNFNPFPNVFICINDAPDCCIEWTYISPCDPPIGDCWIGDLVAFPANCQNDSFAVVIDFNFEDVGSEGFTIHGNGMNYGNFSYDDVPVVIENLAVDCSQSYEFIIIDSEISDCVSIVGLDSVCCSVDSIIYDINYLLGFNGDNTINLLLGFNQNNSDDCQIGVYYDGELQMTLDTDDDVFNLDIGTINCGSSEPLIIQLNSSCDPDTYYTLVIPVEEMDCALSADNLYDKDIITFVDPNNHTLLVKNENTSITIENVFVYDIMGRLVTMDKASNELQFNLTSVSQGMLFVQINLADGRRMIRKVVR